MSTLGRPAARAPINTGDIPDNIITSAKIAADVLTAADIAPNAVTASELADDAVDTAAIADDAVTMAKLSATGTAGATTFLRGDNSWTVVDTEGTGIKSTGETGTAKFLRIDGDGTSSWQAAGSPSISDGGNATAMTIDSAEDVTFEKRAIIPSLKPKSNQNLTGTYSDHEMIIGDQFTLTGDLTINDNLVLASLSGSGQDITITDDGNGRTITTAGRVLSCTTTNTDATVTTASTAELRAGKGVTGTGVPAGATIASITNATTFELSAAATASGTVNLTFDTGIFEAGEFLGTVPPQTDISDMTSGTIQSGVTIGSGVTFPPGHIVQVKSFRLSPDQGTTILSGNAQILVSPLGFDNAMQKATNHVLLMWNGTFMSVAGGSNGHTDMNIGGGGFGAGNTSFSMAGRMSVDGMFYPDPNDTREHPSVTTMDTAPGSTTPTYNINYSCQSSLTFKVSAFDMTLMEIQT
jgi:hypothetical protein